MAILSAKFSLEIIFDEPVMRWVLLSIKWGNTLKIMAHHSSTLTLLITSSSSKKKGKKFKKPSFLQPKPLCLLAKRPFLQVSAVLEGKWWWNSLRMRIGMCWCAICTKFRRWRSPKQTSLATETVFFTKLMYLGKFFFH